MQHANNPVDWYPWEQKRFRKHSVESACIFVCGLCHCQDCYTVQSAAEQCNISGIKERMKPIGVLHEVQPKGEKTRCSFLSCFV
nr:DUF255 domain-containing protein [Pelosinus baikalensis]